jgi:hypothetical protein
MMYVVGKTANETPGKALTFEQLVNAGAFRSGPGRTKLESFGLDLVDATKIRSTNLCSPGTWSFNVALQNWHKLLPHVKPGDCVLLCGADVARACGFPYAPFVSRTIQVSHGCDCDQYATVIVIPHPSGLCRAWNDEDTAKEFRRILDVHYPK